MSQSVVRYTADGSTDEFDVPFPFINRDHIKVTINGAPPILKPTWVGEARIKLRTILVSGSIIEIRRETPLTQRLVDFQNGSVLTEEELDKAISQVFYVQQELNDLYKGALGSALVNIANGNGYTQITQEGLLDELAAEAIARASIQNLQQAIADIALNANTISQVHDRLQSVEDLVNALGGLDGDIATLIANESTQRIAGDTALAETLSLIGAKSGDGLSWVLDMTKVKVSPTESLGSRLTAINASLGDNQAAILAEQNARANGDSALASTISALSARVTTAEAAILTEAQTRASADEAAASSRTALEARVGKAEADIVSEATARVSGDTALSSTLALIGAKNGAGTAFILDMNKVQVGSGVSLGNRLSGIDVALANANATIVSEQNARANADNALTTSVNALSARVSGAEALIASEQAARASGDTALANTVSLLGVKNGAGTAFILSQNNVLISSTESLAQRFSSINTSIGNANAAISNEVTARANAVSSLSSQLNSVSSSLNGVTTSVNQLVSSVNGIQGRYALSIDVNQNAVAGLELIGGGGYMSTFRILADKLELITPGTGTRPFYVENGVTYIADAVIKTGSITKMAAVYGSAYTSLQGQNAGYSTWLQQQFTAYNGTGFPYYVYQPAALVIPDIAPGAAIKLDVTLDHYRTGSDDDQTYVRLIRIVGGVEKQVGDSYLIRSRSGYTLTTLPFVDYAVEGGTYEYRIRLTRNSGGSVWTYFNIGAIVGKR